MHINIELPGMAPWFDHKNLRLDSLLRSSLRLFLCFLWPQFIFIDRNLLRQFSTHSPDLLKFSVRKSYCLKTFLIFYDNYIKLQSLRIKAAIDILHIIELSVFLCIAPFIRKWNTSEECSCYTYTRQGSFSLEAIPTRSLRRGNRRIVATSM